MDSINVKDSNEGVRKLFKILCNILYIILINNTLFIIIKFLKYIEVLEIMISKITELEAVTFLKYDNYV